MDMLSERIDAEMKEAARAQDKRRLGTLRMLKSALKYREIETGKALEDAEIVAVAQTLIKQRRDSAAQYKAGGRPELADNENAEIAILEAFLPRQLSDAELQSLVQEAVSASGAKGPKDMGAVMKALMPKVQGKAEGKRISEAVKAALAAKGS
ncbi:MAG: GatB/YqeY domain-containing protein [Deltaproteobacteria bacterium]|nr:MAG: GatB/YqeY domain-containing protein [Deltaproteobacteria bacterium]